MKFLSPDVALYHYKSTICQYMGIYMLLGIVTQATKWICRTVYPSLAAFVKPLAHHRNVVRLSLFHSYYFGRCSSELAQLVPLLPFSQRTSTCYSDRLCDFWVSIPRCYKDVNSFFPCTARLWNSLPIECFPLTYDLNCRFFLKRFPVCFNLFVLLFLVTPCLVVAVQLCMEWISFFLIKKKQLSYEVKLKLRQFFKIQRKSSAFKRSMKPI